MSKADLSQSLACLSSRFPYGTEITPAGLEKVAAGEKLLHSMGFETANVHLGTAKARAILKDLKARPHGWLYNAARRMVDAVTTDWERWRKR